MLDDIQLPSARTIRMTLVDIDAHQSSEQPIKIFATLLGVLIYAENYGFRRNDETIGAPILISQRRGELVVSLWTDTSCENPTHQISLRRRS